MGQTKTYQQDKYLFRIGEPGGGLIIIKEGTVGLYKNNSSGEEIEISQLGKGDIIGSMTLLSGSPRTATAKALSEVEAQIIEPQQFHKLMVSCPDWLKMIIKDLIARVNISNNKYLGKVSEVESLTEQKMDRMKITCQVARGLQKFGEITAIEENGDKLFSLKEASDFVEKVLVYKRSLFTKIIDDFVRCGFLGPVSKNMQSFELLEDLNRFTVFANELKGSRRKEHEKKLEITPQDKRCLTALVELSKKMELKWNEATELSFSQLESTMASITGQKWQPLVAELAASCGLLETEKTTEGKIIRFIPKELSFYLRATDLCLRIHRYQDNESQAA